MYKTIVALLFLAAVANAQLVGWRNCGSIFATIHRVRVHGCSITPCSFRVGQPIEVEVEATTPAHSINLPFRVTASVFGLPIPLLEGNACEHLSMGYCPALSGHTFIFRLEYIVNDRIPPGITTTVTATLWTDFGEVGVCMQVDAIIVA